MSDDWSQIDVKKVAEPEVDFEIDEEVRAEEAAAKAPLEIEEEADNTIEVDPAAPNPAEQGAPTAGLGPEGPDPRMGRRGQRLAMAEAMAAFCNTREQDSNKVGKYEALPASTCKVKATSPSPGVPPHCLKLAQ